MCLSLCDLVTKVGAPEIGFKAFLGRLDPVRGQYLLISKVQVSQHSKAFWVAEKLELMNTLD